MPATARSTDCIPLRLHRFCVAVTYPPHAQYLQAQPPKRGLSTPAIVAGAVLAAFCAGCVVVTMVSNTSKPTDRAATGPVVVATTAAAPTTAPAVAAATPKASPSSAAPRMVTMPNLVQKNAAVADDELRKLGFTNVQYGSQDKDDKVVLLLPNWTVTKQSTKAGAQVPTDALIVLTCTKQA
jgi:hypothetical protein